MLCNTHTHTPVLVRRTSGPVPALRASAPFRIRSVLHPLRFASALFRIRSVSNPLRFESAPLRIRSVSHPLCFASDQSPIRSLFLSSVWHSLVIPPPICTPLFSNTSISFPSAPFVPRSPYLYSPLYVPPRRSLSFLLLSLSTLVPCRAPLRRSGPVHVAFVSSPFDPARPFPPHPVPVLRPS